MQKRQILQNACRRCMKSVIWLCLFPWAVWFGTWIYGEVEWADQKRWWLLLYLKNIRVNMDPGKLSGLMERGGFDETKIYGIFMLVAIAVFICRRKGYCKFIWIIRKVKKSMSRWKSLRKRWGSRPVTRSGSRGNTRGGRRAGIPTRWILTSWRNQSRCHCMDWDSWLGN